MPKMLFLSNSIKNLAYRIYEIISSWYYSHIFKSYGENIRIGFGLQVLGAEYIDIGNNVQIGKNCYIECSRRGIIVKDGVIIGDNVHIYCVNSPFEDGLVIGASTWIGHNNTINAYAPIIIGNNNLFGQNVIINNFAHEYKYVDLLISKQGGYSRPIHIGNNCYLCSGVFCAGGSFIEDGCIIGGNAFISIRTKKNNIYCGVPAKFVKKRFEIKDSNMNYSVDIQELRLMWFKLVYSEVFKHLEKIKSVCELGSIDLSEKANSSELNIFFEHFSLKSLTKNEISEGEKISTRIFWERIGVGKYACIDSNGVHGATPFDLNYNLIKKYQFIDKFDLVTNFGTTEHVFNQLSCFENIHNLCNTNGLILLSLPLQGWMDHGFYNYHPNFFYALAQANLYKIEKIKYAYWSGTNVCLLDTLDYQLIRNFKEEAISIVVLYRKIFDADFSLPFQGTYQQEVKNKDFKIEMAIKLLLNHLIQQGYHKKELPAEVAVFGTGEAGLMALKCAKNIGARVVCVIDDFKSGTFDGIKIVDRNSFFADYSKECPIVFYGKHQKNSPASKDDVLAIEIDNELVNFSSGILDND